MVDYNDRIKELEQELSTTKYNKRTQHAIGLIKAKIAQLKERQAQRSSKGKKSEGYSVRKSGDATCVLIGLPSVGKSTLLNALTNQESEVGGYAFTTLTVIPGLLEYKDAQIQILDVPGIVEGAASGRGRGKEVLAVMRNADLAIFVLDVFNPEQALNVLQKEVYDADLRINRKVPDVKLTRSSRGGINVQSTVPLELDRDTITGILKEFKISNAHLIIRSPLDVDGFIDIIEKNKVYIPGITVLNKMDMIEPKTLEKIKKKIKPDICISAHKKVNIEELKELIFSKLNFIRIYCKEPGKQADLDKALVMRNPVSIKEVCHKLHRDFVNKFKFARVWGKSAKFPGQKLMLSHTLKDKDIVELHIR